MKINYELVRGHHNWVIENMMDPEHGRVFGFYNIYHKVSIDGVYVGDVFEGEVKASADDRRTKSNGKYWVAFKNGQIVGTPEKSRKKAIEKGLLK